MKCMKMHEGNSGNAALRSGFKAFRLWRPTPRRWITPGGPPVANWEKQCFVCRGNPDSSRFPLATLLRNFQLTEEDKPQAREHEGNKEHDNMFNHEINQNMSQWIFAFHAIIRRLVFYYFFLLCITFVFFVVRNGFLCASVVKRVFYGFSWRVVLRHNRVFRI